MAERIQRDHDLGARTGRLARDILRRLFFQGEFTSKDEDAVHDMMLASKPAPGVSGNDPQPIGQEHIPSDACAVAGRITAVKNLQNVNRIDSAQELPFEDNGLAVERRLVLEEIARQGLGAEYNTERYLMSICITVAKKRRDANY